jgi:hypothetical protein
MKNVVLTAACILTLSATGALAQSSQGKAGSDNGPTSNSVTTNGSGSAGMSGGTGGMQRRGMSIDGTVGASRNSGDTSSEGNVGPGTSNNSGKQPGGR